MIEKPRDGVGEYLVIETLRLDTTHRGRGHDFWIASGRLNGLTMHLHIWKEDFKMFTEAGYSNLFSDRKPKKDLMIGVTTDWRGGYYRVGSVEPMIPAVTEETTPVEGVLSNEARVAQWLKDVEQFGTPDTTTYALTAIFKHGARWFKNADATYTRLQGESKQVYACKATQQPKPAYHSIKDASLLIRHLANGYQGDYDMSSTHGDY